MPTFQEAQEAAQAQVQSLMQAKAKYEAMLSDQAEAAKVQQAAMAVSPFGFRPAQVEQSEVGPGGVGLNPFGSTTTSVVRDAPMPEQDHGDAFVIGLLLIFLIVLFAVIFGRWRRR